MADAPKSKPSDSSKTSTGPGLGFYIAIIIAFVVIGYIGTNITPVNIDTVASGDLFKELGLFLQGKATSQPEVNAFFLGIKNFLLVLSVLFFAGIVWLGLRSREVHHAEHEKYKPIHIEETEAKGRMIQWQVVLNHVNSESPAEWKLGILEADNMLDEILEDQGYFGETVADKLKAMSPSRITSYQELWEAHKVRNEIAHGGAIDMELSKKVARDTIANFGKAFKELGYI